MMKTHVLTAAAAKHDRIKNRIQSLFIYRKWSFKCNARVLVMIADTRVCNVELKLLPL